MHVCACVLCSSHEYIVSCITEHVEFFPKEILSELIANEDVCVRGCARVLTYTRAFMDVSPLCKPRSGKLIVEYIYQRYPARKN